MASSKDKKKDLAASFNDAAKDSKTKYPEMALDDMLPTQITVGMHAMHHKAERLHDLKDKPKQLKEYLDERPIEVVLGPGGKAYVIDHHHLALALLHEGYKKAQVHIVDDLSNETSQEAFWKKMEEKKYVHPYDENGKEQPISAIPKRLKDLVDDPYRSLAGFVRDMGLYKKVTTPFAEFKWADYFRKIIPLQDVNENFDNALKLAGMLASLSSAAHLPGFIKPKIKDKKPKAS